ncbi:MAG: DegV family protein [Eubacteriales bacterium]
MSFALFTDSTAGLTEAEYNANQIEVLPLSLSLNDDEILCYEPGVVFDSDAFFQRMREDATLVMKTSMVNTSAFLAAFEPRLEAGEDVLYLGMAGGISGTCGAGQVAAEILQKKYPERKMLVVDTLSAVLGQAMILLETAKLRNEGASAEEAAAHAERRSHEVRSYIMVDDLNFLKRGGRISGHAALAGNIMHMKPILKGDEEGRLVLNLKILGRKKAIKTMFELFDKTHVASDINRKVGITHTGCEDEAHLLAADIVEKYPDVDVKVTVFEPCTSSHVGPGAIGLFFF